MSFNAGNGYPTQPMPTTQNYNTEQHQQQYAQPQQPQPQPQQPQPTDVGLYIPPYVVVPPEEYTKASEYHHTQYFCHNTITPVPVISFEKLVSRLPILQIEERYRSNPPARCRRNIPQGTLGNFYYRVDEQNQSGNNQNHQNLGDQQNHRGNQQNHHGNHQNQHEEPYIPPYVIVSPDEFLSALADHHSQFFSERIVTPLPVLSHEELMSKLPFLQIEPRYHRNPPSYFRRIIPKNDGLGYKSYYRANRQNHSEGNQYHGKDHQNHQNSGDNHQNYGENHGENYGENQRNHQNHGGSHQNYRGNHQNHRGNNQNHHGNDRYTQNTQQPFVSNPQDFQTPGSFEYNTYPSAASQAMLRPIMDDSEVQPPTTETGRDRDLTKTELTLWQDDSIRRDLLRIAFQHRDEIRKNMFAIVPAELSSSNLQAEPAVLQYIKSSAQEEAECRFFEIKQMDMKMTQSC